MASATWILPGEAGLLTQITELQQAVQAAYQQWAALLAAESAGQPIHYTPTLFDKPDGPDGFGMLAVPGPAGLPRQAELCAGSFAAGEPRAEVAGTNG